MIEALGRVRADLRGGKSVRERFNEARGGLLVRGSFRKACWVHLQGRDAKSDVERIARLGFREVLPNVVTVGGPLYPSRVRPQHPQAGGRDLVGEFVKEAKRRGLRVHAWIVSSATRTRRSRARTGTGTW
jgi:Uncharacterized protein conserved in bacteria